MSPTSAWTSSRFPYSRTLSTTQSGFSSRWRALRSWSQKRRCSRCTTSDLRGWSTRRSFGFNLTTRSHPNAVASLRRVETSKRDQPFSYRERVAGDVSVRRASWVRDRPSSLRRVPIWLEISVGGSMLLSYMIIDVKSTGIKNFRLGSPFHPPGRCPSCCDRRIAGPWLRVRR